MTKTFSVVVCAYNSGEKILATLASLHAQKYPKAAYEIIVVDDGSTDDTATIVADVRDVTLVSYTPNKGHAAARNAGLAAANGKWIAFIDDDCIADPSWLQELEAALSESHVIGVGGKIDPLRLATIAQRYVYRSGYGRPASLELGAATSLLGRLKAYVKDKFTQTQRHDQEVEHVQEVYGANCAFPVKELRFAGGYNLQIRSAEDVEVCARLRRNYPEYVFVYTPKARIVHDYMVSFAAYLRKIFYRQNDTLHFYRSEGKPAPLFPFPLLWAAGVGVSALLWQWWAVMAALTLPLALYSWWVVALLRSKQLEYAGYCYMQLAEESTRLTGLLWAMWMSLAGKTRMLSLVIIALTGMSLAKHYGGDMFHVPLALAAVMLPGYLLARIVKLRASLPAVTTAILWIPLGVAWVLFMSLLAVAVLPLFGVSRPLDELPLVSTWLVSALSLLLLAYRTRLTIRRRLFQWRWDGAGLLGSYALILLGVSVGAGLLNNGFGGEVATASLLLTLGMLGCVAWRLPRLPAWAPIASLSVAALAFVWSYSLRSNFVFGWDIQQEYAVLRATQAAGTWAITDAHSPYSAMLSLTTLPTALAQLSGLSGLNVYKVLFPIFFSIVPALLYLLYRQFAKRRVAFAAAIVFMAQFAFMQQFAGMVRQQLGFMFFVALVYALLHRTLPKSARQWLVGISIFGLVVSHYSTAYVGIALLALAWLAGRVLHRAPLRRYVSGWAILALTAGAVLWYGPITQMSAGYNAVLAGNATLTMLQQKYLKHDVAPGSTQEYLANVGEQYQTKRPYLTYYEGVTNQEVQPKEPQELPAAWPLLQKIATVLDAAIRSLWWIAAVAGVAILAWSAWLWRKQRRIEFVLLAGASLVVFAVAHAFPSIETFYNISRLNQQCLLFVALPAIVGLVWLLEMIRKAKYAIAVVSVCILLAALSATGIMAMLVGGNATANLHNQGADYARFYTQPQDAAAARWLNANFQRGTVIYADRYAQLHLTSHTTLNQGALNDITPATLSKGSYVYASSANLHTGIAASGKSANVFTYEFPQTFLVSEKNIIYANGGAEVYK